MPIEPAIRYPEISPRSYEHPADRAATSALHAIPPLDRLVKRFGRLGAETRFRQMVLGAWVQSGDFDRIRAGAYVRRGDDPAPSAELDAPWATTGSASAGWLIAPSAG